MTPLNLAHWGVTEDVNGPGRRFTVWVQGCPRDCPGCFNPGLRAAVARRQVAPGFLAGELTAAEPVDGITLSGGEPFSQAAALAEFLDALDAARGSPLPVIAFSGYTLEELRNGTTAWARLLARIDLLVDGPYRPDLAATEPLTGSSNQRRLALTPVGETLLAKVESDPPGVVEVQITAAGEVLFSGFPSPDLLERLHSPPPEN